MVSSRPRALDSQMFDTSHKGCGRHLNNYSSKPEQDRDHDSSASRGAREKKNFRGTQNYMMQLQGCINPHFKFATRAARSFPFRF